MTDSIREALERLLELEEKRWGASTWDDAVAAARAALAQPELEGPTDEELTQFLFEGFRGPIEFLYDTEEEAHLMIRSHVRFARAVLARWGRPATPAAGEVK